MFKCLIGQIEQYTVKNKDSVLAKMVQLRAFNINEIFPLYKRFFIVENDSLDYSNVL